MRSYAVGRTIMAGCFNCWGSEAHWFAKNAQAVAARHHDATGHCTWVDVGMSIRYGRDPTEAATAPKGPA